MTEQRDLPAGMRVRVHYNLHRGGYSVVNPSTGRVIAHVADITLTGVVFRVQPGGLARIRRTGQRAVCAYALGHVAEVDTDPDRSACTRVTFNPHRADRFHLPDGTPIETAPAVIFADRAGWVA